MAFKSWFEGQRSRQMMREGFLSRGGKVSKSNGKGQVLMFDRRLNTRVEKNINVTFVRDTSPLWLTTAAVVTKAGSRRIKTRELLQSALTRVLASLSCSEQCNGTTGYRSPLSCTSNRRIEECQLLWIIFDTCSQTLLGNSPFVIVPKKFAEILH